MANLEQSGDAKPRDCRGSEPGCRKEGSPHINLKPFLGNEEGHFLSTTFDMGGSAIDPVVDELYES